MKERVYVVLKRQPRFRGEAKESPAIYAWTSSKATLKAYLQQRDVKKYTFLEMDYENFKDEIGWSGYSLEELMIDSVLLPSKRSSKDVLLFTNREEWYRIQEAVRNLFTKAAALEAYYPADRLTRVIDLITNLKTRYADALYFLGYRPKELDAVYDSVGYDYYDDYIASTLVGDTDIPLRNIARESREACYLDDPFKIVIYSLESVIKVMLDDL